MSLQSEPRLHFAFLHAAVPMTQTPRYAVQPGHSVALRQSLLDVAAHLPLRGVHSPSRRQSSAQSAAVEATQPSLLTEQRPSAQARFDAAQPAAEAAQRPFLGSHSPHALQSWVAWQSAFNVALQWPS